MVNEANTAARDADASPYVHMLIASFCFACMAATVHWLGESVNWTLVTFCRMIFAVLLLTVIAKARGIPIVFTGPPALWVRAVAGSFGMIGNFYAIATLPVSDAVAIYHTMPIWVAVIRRVVYRESLSWTQWGCVAGAILGVFVAEEFSGTALSLGVVAAFVAAFSFAFAVVAMSFLGGYHPQSVTMHFSFFATFVALAAMAISAPAGGTFVPPSAWIALGLLVPPVLGSIAQILMTGAMGRGHNVTTALIGLTQLVFAGTFDAVLWHRSFTPIKLAGFGLIVICVIGMTALRPKQRSQMAEIVAK